MKDDLGLFGATFWRVIDSLIDQGWNSDYSITIAGKQAWTLKQNSYNLAHSQAD